MADASRFPQGIVIQGALDVARPLNTIVEYDGALYISTDAATPSYNVVGGDADPILLGVRYYLPTIQRFGAAANGTASNTLMYAKPYAVTRRRVISTAGVRTATISGGTGTAVMGIYTGAAGPVELVSSVLTFAIANSTTTEIPYTFEFLPGTVYWIATSTTALAFLGGGGASGNGILGCDNTGAYYGSLRANYVYNGSLPDVFPAWELSTNLAPGMLVTFAA